MAKRKYFKKHIDYLREITPGRRNHEITRLFNEWFGMNASECAISTLRLKNGIKLTVPRTMKQYTIEQLAYLQELSDRGLFNREITRLFNGRFGTSRTEIAIQQQRCKYGFKTAARYYWKSGHKPWNKGMKGWFAPGTEQTQFKKGDMPQTYAPVGTEIITDDGYLKVKVADPNKWAYKHRLIWEQHHDGREIPEGHAVIFGDGDKGNLDPDNLLLVSRAQLCRMNQLDLIKNDARLTRIGITIASIHNKVGKRKRKSRELETGNRERGNGERGEIGTEKRKEKRILKK